MGKLAGMEVWRGVADVTYTGGVLSLGFFDGVHLGHQHLIDEVRAVAKDLDAPTIAVTMWPHPRIVLGSEPGKFRLINDLSSKLGYLEDAGVDAVLILDFSLEMARVSPVDFLESVLYAPLQPKGIVMGYDHRFGYRGEGDYPLLKAFCDEKGIVGAQGAVESIEGEEVSSTLIRQAVASGFMEKAARLLGREFAFCGRVVKGKQLGNRIGFPTANIEPRSRWQLLPGHGVYEGYIQLPLGMGGQRLRAVVNVGTRPTVDSSGIPSVEAHILDYDGMLYGEELQVSFARKIRDELRFSGLDALKAQIARDVEQVRNQGY